MTDGSVTLAWEKPRFDGGSPITGYLVEHSQRGDVEWLSSRKITTDKLTTEIRDLCVGEYFFIRIYALNEVGRSKRASDLHEPVCVRKPTSELNSLLSKQVTLKP